MPEALIAQSGQGREAARDRKRQTRAEEVAQAPCFSKFVPLLALKLQKPQTCKSAGLRYPCLAVDCYFRIGNEEAVAGAG
jgi:hypothetical protein